MKGNELTQFATATLPADPFAADPIPRDGYDRPLIIPVKGRAAKPDLKAKLVPYTRVSTFAKALDEAGGLTTWSVRHVALGLGRNPDLAALTGVYGPTYTDLSRSDLAELDKVIERAHDRVGGNAQADHGTAVHALTEPNTPGVTPDHMVLDVNAYHAELRHYGIVPVLTEQFVVNDELQVAGTFDHLYEFTRDIWFELPTGASWLVSAGTRVIGDKKTGKIHVDSQSIQLAIYANGSLYNPETGERTDYGEHSTKWGILAHVPKGSETANLYLVDIEAGYAAAKLAGQVRAHRSNKALSVLFPAVGGAPPPTVTQSATDRAQAEAAAFAETLAANEAKARVEAATVRMRAELDATEARIKAERSVAASPPDDADKTEAEVLAMLSGTLGAVPVVPLSTQLERATSRDELAEIWRANKAVWTDAHTAVLKAMAIKFPVPATA